MEKSLESKMTGYQKLYNRFNQLTDEYLVKVQRELIAMVIDETKAILENPESYTEFNSDAKETSSAIMMLFNKFLRNDIDINSFTHFMAFFEKILFLNVLPRDMSFFQDTCFDLKGSKKSDLKRLFKLLDEIHDQLNNLDSMYDIEQTIKTLPSRNGFGTIRFNKIHKGLTSSDWESVLEAV